MSHLNPFFCPFNPLGSYPDLCRNRKSTFATICQILLFCSFQNCCQGSPYLQSPLWKRSLPAFFPLFSFRAGRGRSICLLLLPHRVCPLCVCLHSEAGPKQDSSHRMKPLSVDPKDVPEREVSNQPIHQSSLCASWRGKDLSCSNPKTIQRFQRESSERLLLCPLLLTRLWVTPGTL